MISSLSNVPYINRLLYQASRKYIDKYRSFSYNFEENGELALIQKVAKIVSNKSTPVFFDVGGNLGKWTQEAKKASPQSAVHVFEVTPATYANLQENIGKLENVTLNNKGLSNKEGQMEVKSYGTNNGANTLLQSATYHDKKKSFELVNVDVTTGDAYISTNNITHIDLLKIDTEGWEYFVLEGFTNMLADKKVDIIQFEYGYTHADAKTLMKDFYKFFEVYGYKVGKLTQKGVLFQDFSYELNDFRSGPNFVACLPEFKSKLESFS